MKIRKELLQDIIAILGMDELSEVDKEKKMEEEKKEMKEKALQKKGNETKNRVRKY